jgi:hypothetical protein
MGKTAILIFLVLILVAFYRLLRQWSFLRKRYHSPLEIDAGIMIKNLGLSKYLNQEARELVKAWTIYFGRCNCSCGCEKAIGPFANYYPTKHALCDSCKNDGGFVREQTWLDKLHDKLFPEQIDWEEWEGFAQECERERADLERRLTRNNREKKT